MRGKYALLEHEKSLANTELSQLSIVRAFPAED